MKKNIRLVLLIAIAIVYIIVGALLFFNIQSMEAPEIIINIDIGEINSENAILQTKMDIFNPNGFEIVTQNLLIVITTPEDHEVSRTFLPGGEIGPNQKKTFSDNIVLSFEGHSPSILTSIITGEVGANIFFIQKTIPLNIGIVTSLDKFFDDVNVPKIDTTIEVIDINTENIDIEATLDVYNPNDFRIYIGDISNDIETQSGKKIGKIDLIGGYIQEKETLSMKAKGTIYLEAFNEKTIELNLSGTVAAEIAGFEKNLTFNVKNNILMPDIQELVFSNDKPTILSVKVKGRITLRGYLFEIIMEVDNKYNVDLSFKNTKSELYLVKNDNQRFIGECKNIEDITVKSGENEVTTCEILVPYSKLFLLDRSTDWIMNSVISNISIAGVNQSVYFEVRGYQEINIIT